MLTRCLLKKSGDFRYYVACQHAQIEIVKFLLDSDLPLGAVDDRDQEEWTPLISAAYSTGTFGEGADADAADRVRDEALINMLLDRALLRVIMCHSLLVILI